MGCLICLSASGFPIEPKQSDLKIFTEKQPYGTVTRKEWSVNPNAMLYRLEIDNATAGKMLLDKTRLTYNSTDGWKLTDFDDKLILTISQADIDAKKPIELKTNYQIWGLLVRGQNIPKVIPGIATEGKNSLDITLIRMH